MIELIDLFFNQYLRIFVGVILIGLFYFLYILSLKVNNFFKANRLKVKDLIILEYGNLCA